MATLTTGAGYAARIDLLTAYDLRNGVPTTTTGNLYAVNGGNGFLNSFSGTNLAYTNGMPTAGTITGYVYTQNGATILAATGTAVDAAAFTRAVQADDTATMLGLFFAGDDDVTGGALNDYVPGLAGNDVLRGGDGADTLLGGDGADHIYGCTASGGADAGDTLSGGNGSDYIQGNAGNDAIDGGAGEDRIYGGADNDAINGGDGHDTINGNRGNDMIDGGSGNDRLRGGQGDDVVMGRDGNDVVMGDLGNDTLRGGTGIDVLTGGDGADTFIFAAGDAAYATSGTLADFVDVVTDYAGGIDRLSLSFSIAAVLRGSAANLAAATTVAQALIDGHAGNGEVAAIQVGSSTYLMYSGTGGAAINSAIRLDGVASTAITAADFV